MAISEYLFIDEDRLMSYISQINGNLITYDKVPVYETEASLLGPKARALQTRFQRETTAYERIEIFEKYLQKHEKDKVSDLFKCETFHASKIIIPKKLFPKNEYIPNISLWLVEKDFSLLYIIAGPSLFDNSDSPTMSYYSALRYAIEKIGAKIQMDITDDTNNPELYPIEFFESAGAIVSEPRKITALYKYDIRGGVYGDYDSFPIVVGTVAYAIFVKEAAA